MKKIEIILFTLCLFFVSFYQPNVLTGIVGDPQDIRTVTESGVCLAGGGTSPDNSFRWMIERAGGGDFLVLASDYILTDYNNDIYALGNVNSVETIIVNSRQMANSDYILNKVHSAEAIYIAGGDQSDYIKKWRNTRLNEALNEKSKVAPIGGTSAGLHILGGYYYGATYDSVSTGEVLENPYGRNVTGLDGGFLTAPFLKDIITDSHYSNRNRHGRLLGFMARLLVDQDLHQLKGIGVDENTAVCIDCSGVCSIYGEGKAYFLTSKNKHEICYENSPLTWFCEGHAVKVCVIDGTENGINKFSISQWRGEGDWQFWFARNGEFSEQDIAETGL